jgi:hypothetical protein
MFDVRCLRFEVRGSRLGVRVGGWRIGEDFIHLKTIFVARVSRNLLLRGLSGSFDKTIVIKNYRGKTVVCKYPRMRKVEPSEKQKRQAEKLKEAVAFARGVLKNEKLKVQYAQKAKKSLSLYHYLVQMHMKGKVGGGNGSRTRGS